MDNPPFWELPNTATNYKFDDEHFLSSYEQSKNLVNGIERDYLNLDDLDIPFDPLSPGPDSLDPSSTASSELESPEDDPVLKFLNQILVEEGMEEKPSMFHDPLALRATEKSLYEVIGQAYPPSPYNPTDQTAGSPDSLFGSSSEYNNSTNSASSPIDPQWIGDPSEYNPVLQQDSSSNSNIQTNSFETHNLLRNIFSDSESILQFKRGMEEANKFLPTTNPLIIDLDKYELPKKSEDISPAVMVKVEKDNMDQFSNGLKGRKHHYREDDDLEDMERSSKQSAVYNEDDELSEMFDRVLLFNDGNCGGGTIGFACDTGPMDQNVPTNRGKARDRKNESTGETVDLRSLLISCAQSVASDDRRTTYEQLRQIRKHASPTGDVYQRLASAFAHGLEARLGGTGNELYASFARRKITAAEKLKAYHAYVSACPFKKRAISFANMSIGFSALESTTLHIVDFGILYGFQWPILIQHMAKLHGGSRKLRITGIELPQRGFRPLEQIEETGSRLRKYCKRFGVPFEYQAIARQNWETIKIEDLKIAKGEFLAVNCLFRFGKLLDETVVEDSPRDAVLKLIRKMKPDIFVNSITNGSYNAPFFVTRFKETLFHYSALFDMFDATLPRDNPHRMHFEQDFYGHEVINVIACEGAERVERPETYKQWHARHLRAGFKPVPLDGEIMKKLENKVGCGYHKDFLFDGDGTWMLQGWKGRILVASSCWVPA